MVPSPKLTRLGLLCTWHDCPSPLGLFGLGGLWLDILGLFDLGSLWLDILGLFRVGA